MATFSISISIEVEADSYEAAYEKENELRNELELRPDVMGVYGIDVEQTDGFEEEEE